MKEQTAQQAEADKHAALVEQGRIKKQTDEALARSSQNMQIMGEEAVARVDEHTIKKATPDEETKAITSKFDEWVAAEQKTLVTCNPVVRARAAPAGRRAPTRLLQSQP